LIGGNRDTAALASPLLDQLEDLSRLTVRQAKKLAVLIVGGGLLLAGVVMLALPGPGLLVILTGLTILGTHFVWARKLLARAKRETQSMMAKGRKFFKRS
jgi:uncharacterized protein (TIGR02611 family)